MTPEDRKYTESHEWVKTEGGHAVVGITDHAQDALGDITFVELPETGTPVTRGGECCVVESVKAASDIYAPLSGTIAEVNTALTDAPELINSSPYDTGWIFKIKDIDESELDSLMDAQAYESFLEHNE